MNLPNYNQAIEQQHIEQQYINQQQEYYPNIQYINQVLQAEKQPIYNMTNLYANLRSRKDYYAQYLAISSFNNLPCSEVSYIRGFGKYLGVNLNKRPYLLKYVIAAIIEPLPPNWDECIDEKGDIYYSNKTTQENHWRHPCDEHYKSIIKEKLKNKKKSWW